jgi:hypothetical protein
MRAVNAYFKRRLFAVPGIASYIRDLHERERAADRRGGCPRMTASTGGADRRDLR